MSDLIQIPARKGKAAFVSRGQSVKLVNTHGSQVVDTWAFARHDLKEFMSMDNVPSHWSCVPVVSMTAMDRFDIAYAYEFATLGFDPIDLSGSSTQLVVR